MKSSLRLVLLNMLTVTVSGECFSQTNAHDNKASTTPPTSVTSEARYFGQKLPSTEADISR